MEDNIILALQDFHSEATNTKEHIDVTIAFVKTILQQIIDSQQPKMDALAILTSTLETYKLEYGEWIPK